jgi:hypothetical protein
MPAFAGMTREWVREVRQVPYTYSLIVIASEAKQSSVYAFAVLAGLPRSLRGLAMTTVGLSYEDSGLLRLGLGEGAAAGKPQRKKFFRDKLPRLVRLVSSGVAFDCAGGDSSLD